MVKKASAFVALITLATMGLTGCGGSNAEAKKTEECIAQLEQTLKEAGSDRELRTEEKDACADPEQREFIMGG